MIRLAGYGRSCPTYLSIIINYHSSNLGNRLLALIVHCNLLHKRPEMAQYPLYSLYYASSNLDRTKSVNTPAKIDANLKLCGENCLSVGRPGDLGSSAISESW